MMVWFDVWPSCGDRPRARCSCAWRSSPRSASALFLSAVNVRYRDVPYAIPFIIQIWLFLSGVVYAISALPEKWQWLLALNPMTGGHQRLPVGRPRRTGARPRQDARQRRRGASRSSSSASGTSGAPSRASRTRSDGDRDHASRASRSGTASASCRARYGTLRDSLAGRGAPRRASRARHHYEEIWALRDVSFDVAEGRGARHRRAQRRRQVDAAARSSRGSRRRRGAAPRSADASAACSRSGRASIPS